MVFGLFSKDKKGKKEDSPDISGESKNSAKELGRQGEAEAVRVLKKKKYKIVECNYRTRFGEIDIIAVAVKTRTVIFVEVKTRRGRSYGLPKDAVDARKQGRLLKSADMFMMANQRTYSDYDARFDVLSIELKDGKFQTEHIENAFGRE